MFLYLGSLVLEDNVGNSTGPYKDADIIKAYEWLGQIEAAFTEARATSIKYADSKKKKGKLGELEPLDEEKTLDLSGSSTKNLVVSLKSISKERQRHLSLPRKITWSLYGKDSFESLIEDLVTLINNLVELFPSNNRRLEELCNQELSGLEKESILKLVEILRNDDERLKNTDDEILSKVIGKHIESHRLEFRNIKVEGNGVNRFGDEYGYKAGVNPGSLSLDGMEVKGNSFTQVGHVFHGNQGAGEMSLYRELISTSRSQGRDAVQGTSGNPESNMEMKLPRVGQSYLEKKK